MQLSEEQLKKVVQLGCLGYDLDRCVNVVEPDDEAAFRREFRTDGSQVAKAYKKGADIAAFAIDSKLFELAKGGDLKALSMFEERQRKRRT